MQTLVNSWRKEWKQGIFPFYYCQIAPYDYSLIKWKNNSALLREKQMEAEKMDLGLLWSIADTFNGLMAIPNLIALLLLSGTVVRLVREFFAGEGKESARAESSN